MPLLLLGFGFGKGGDVALLTLPRFRQVMRLEREAVGFLRRLVVGFHVGALLPGDFGQVLGLQGELFAFRTHSVALVDERLFLSLKHGVIEGGLDGLPVREGRALEVG